MNYYSLAPQFYSQTPRNTPMLINNPIYKNNQLIHILSQALKTSINHFASNITGIIRQQKVGEKQENITCERIGEKGLVQLTEEEVEERNQNLKKMEKENIRLNNRNLISRNSQKVTQNHIYVQKLLKKTEIELPNKKYETSIRTNKDKLKQKINETPIDIPIISLIEAAQLPILGMKDLQLSKMRDNLLLRRVDQWSDKFKSKKDRRQIRMLKN